MMPRTETIAITREQGGDWIHFAWNQDDEDGPHGRGGNIHSILFADGSIWDSVNGWREEVETRPFLTMPGGWVDKPRIRVRMGRT
jgi:hypothetical protein